MNSKTSVIPERLAHVESELDSQRVAIGRIESAINNLIRQFSESQKAPWTTLAAWAAVILSVVALGVSPFAAQMLETRDDLKQHAMLDGHRPMAQRVLTLEGTLSELKKEQREAHSQLLSRDELLNERIYLVKDDIYAKLDRLKTDLFDLKLSSRISNEVVINKLDSLDKNDSAILQNQAGFKKETNEATQFIRDFYHKEGK